MLSLIIRKLEISIKSFFLLFLLKVFCMKYEVEVCHRNEINFWNIFVCNFHNVEYNTAKKFHWFFHSPLQNIVENTSDVCSTDQPLHSLVYTNQLLYNYSLHLKQNWKTFLTKLFISNHQFISPDNIKHQWRHSFNLYKYK